MRTLTLALLGMSFALAACGGTDSNNKKTVLPQCSDGEDNDGDGLIDFPDDPGCISEADDEEISLPSPQCSDGRDNDGDGKIDFPLDPGCASLHQDTETDDCPDGPNCPQCANGKDDDGNGQTDYPSDIGCSSASDNDEFTEDPEACGENVILKQLPFDGHVIGGNLGPGGPSNLNSATCGGSGKEDVYELRLSSPKVIKATTNLPGTSPMTDTVLVVRDIGCMTELACNDDTAELNAIDGSSQITVSAPTAGVYYLVVDNNSGLGGAYELQVNLLAGEGEACDPAAPTTVCGDGLVCRIPLNGTTNVCSQPECRDGVDDDGDGKNDYPEEPGCDSPDDNDETDTCPGAGCPACADGIDNDGDTHIDYPDDPNCTSASQSSESCADTDAVITIAAASTMGTTVGAHDDGHHSCGSTTATAPDRTLRFSPPMPLDSLTVTTTATGSWDAITAVLGPSCGGTELACSDFSPITLTNVTSDIYIVVDGYSTASGAFTIGLTGKIRNGASCEGAFVTSGAFTCGATATCSGTAGSKLCQPFACVDGIDNDADGKIDYPFDPGCSSPSDNDETNPTTLPVCSNTVDEDTDGTIDFPADVGCSSAADTSEAFCPTETDPVAGAINAKLIMGTTVGKTNNQTPTCQMTSNADVVYSLNLPVPVTSLQLDTNGTSFDTVLSLVDTHCATTLFCDDDGGDSTDSLVLASNLSAGNYAVVVDGYSTNSGAFTLNVNGTVASGTVCTATAFQGANAWLHCPTGTTCTGGTCH